MGHDLLIRRGLNRVVDVHPDTAQQASAGDRGQHVGGRAGECGREGERRTEQRQFQDLGRSLPRGCLVDQLLDCERYAEEEQAGDDT